jgi:hypothetical protein
MPGFVQFIEQAVTEVKASDASSRGASKTYAERVTNVRGPGLLGGPSRLACQTSLKGMKDRGAGQRYADRSATTAPRDRRRPPADGVLRPDPSVGRRDACDDASKDHGWMARSDPAASPSLAGVLGSLAGSDRSLAADRS